MSYFDGTRHLSKKVILILSAGIVVFLVLIVKPVYESKASSNDGSLPFPIRGIFYYPWFPETWRDQKNQLYTHYNPSLGYYSSSDSAILTQQIKAMQYGGMQLGIFEWNGQGTVLDHRIPSLLQAAIGTGFHWAVYYDQEGLSIGNGPNPTPDQITSDLTYINATYASNPSYALINGKPLIFVYNDASDDCGMVDRWKQASKDTNDYIVLKVFNGYTKCGNQPDGWHQYNPQQREDSQSSYSFAISPGFWKAGEDTPRLSRDAAVFRQSVHSMVDSHAPFQLVTTFNEWGEGSAVEDAKEWESASKYGTYLDILHSVLVNNQ